ncbi:MAG: hypothetical protein JKY90_08645 [Gammaproteobacteria bacterium]|nr:hypothetical protein [Gammaproteobacteria bacterium]
MQALLQNELLNHPAIEAAIVPFVIALIAGAILPKRFSWWSTLVFAVAYFFAAWLILDGRLSPLSSSRKLVILGACAVITGLIARRFFSANTLQHVLIILTIAAVGWLIWPKLIRIDIWQQIILATSTGIYALWLTFAFHQMRDEDIATSVSATILAIATGLCALIGASSLLGELAIAVGASTAAITLYGLARRADHGAGFYFPVAVLCALIGIASVVYAKVPWYVLIVLASIPLIAMLFEWRYKLGMMRVIKLATLILIPAIIAVFLTEQIAGPIPI